MGDDAMVGGLEVVSPGLVGGWCAAWGLLW